MVDIEIGQTFLHLRATSYQGVKPKYFITMSRANDVGDEFACFVMNTERRMPKYCLNCNKSVQKFIIAPSTFSFIKNYTAIMLSIPCLYKYEEIYESNIKLLDIASNLLCKQIKNCVDWDYIQPKIALLIKEAFKTFS